MSEINNRITEESLSLNNYLNILHNSMDDKLKELERLNSEAKRLIETKKDVLRQMASIATFLEQLEPFLQLAEKNPDEAYQKYKERLKKSHSQVETEILGTLNINYNNPEVVNKLEPPVLFSVLTLAFKRLLHDYALAQTTVQKIDNDLKQYDQNIENLRKSIEETRKDIEETEKQIEQVKERIIEESKKEPIWQEIQELKKKKAELEEKLRELS